MKGLFESLGCRTGHVSSSFATDPGPAVMCPRRSLHRSMRPRTHFSHSCCELTAAPRSALQRKQSWPRSQQTPVVAKAAREKKLARAASAFNLLRHAYSPCLHSGCIAFGRELRVFALKVLLPAPRALVPCIACAAAFFCWFKMEDDDHTFASLLEELQVPEPLREAILATGIQTTADFVYTKNSAADLSNFVAKQSQALWGALGVTDPEHCAPIARLRRALDNCKSLTQALDRSSPASGPKALNAWAEHAPPRLDSDAVQRMVDTFKGKYPGELLEKDSVPQLRTR